MILSLNSSHQSWGVFIPTSTIGRLSYDVLHSGARDAACGEGAYAIAWGSGYDANPDAPKTCISLHLCIKDAQYLD